MKPREVVLTAMKYLDEYMGHERVRHARKMEKARKRLRLK